MGTMSATAVAAAEEDDRGRGVWMQYVDALEEERRKIQVFRRELPLCLELVTQTIESYREQMRISSCGNGSDMVVDHRPAAVLEEFIPRRRSDATRSSSTHEEEGVNSRMVDGIDGEEPAAAGACCSERKVSKEEEEEGEGEIGSENPLMPTADWLNLAQLWHHNTESSVKEVCMQEQPSHQEEQNHQLQPPPTKPILVEARRPTGAFQPFCRPKPASTPAAPADTSSSAAPAAVATPIVVAPPPPPPASQQQPTAVEESSTNDSAGDGRGGSGAGMTAESSGHASSTGDQELLQQQKKVEAGGGHTQSSSGTSSNHRKSRRCWSPELHRRFLNAIKQLGGSHVATPKQIRDLMKVDGLTNDEVKSHLQKYRLHTRRPAMTPVTGAPTHTTPHFLLVSGIWLPPQEYTAAAAAASQQPQGHHSGVLAPSATPSPKPPSSPPQVCRKQVVASAPVIETRPPPQSQSKTSENKGLPQPGSSTTSSTSSHTSQ